MSVVERRCRKFRIDRPWFARYPEMIATFMEGMVILSASFSLSWDALEYEAWREDWGVLGVGVEACYCPIKPILEELENGDRIMAGIKFEDEE
ncbi:MAG: hypothetical protein KAS32_25025 [Candidatus Peribacteraceae bacterium]|nr:hypothetical protein [Candidatus Peribacteraceae bacterium]